jgi:hypothetical protein
MNFQAMPGNVLDIKASESLLTFSRFPRFLPTHKYWRRNISGLFKLGLVATTPPGLRKQYELQLEQVKAQAPNLELLLFPRIVFSRVREKVLKPDRARLTHTNRPRS